MYNRYTPREDGGYRRDRVEDAAPTGTSEISSSPPLHNENEPQDAAVASEKTLTANTMPRKPNEFLRDLLPKDMDGGDLLLLLILILLMADGSDASGIPLLTLSLFFLLQ